MLRKVALGVALGLSSACSRDDAHVENGAGASGSSPGGAAGEHSGAGRAGAGGEPAGSDSGGAGGESIGAAGLGGEGGRMLSLWNGFDLSEWRGDSNVWSVEDDAIVANAPEGTVEVNTFLVHERTFSNFVLRAEVWLEAGGDSGIQYRSEVFDQELFRVRGYQADVRDESFGLLYEEQGRRLLADTSPGCAASGEAEAWNLYEITADGPELVHAVNGVECVRYVEELAEARQEGVIALQYHRPGGFEVRYRNLVLTEL
jgi:hypothetical protein